MKHLMNSLSLLRKCKNEKSMSIAAIRTNHEGEFDSQAFESYSDTYGIDHNFLAPRKP